MMRKGIGCLLVAPAVVLWVAGRGLAQTGAGRTPIKLVVRADDIGSCHAANLACIKCFQEGIARSVEVMVWIVIEHPGLDTPEMQALGHKRYWEVAAHRDGVTKAFTSAKVKEVIKRRGIQLVSYHDMWPGQ